MAVSIDDIIHKEFSRSLMGYDMQEVDVFLDTVIERIEKMEGERAEMIQAMEKLLKRVERLEKAKEKPALTGGESTVKKPAVTAGPVRVQGGKARSEAEEKSVRKKRPAAGEPAEPQTPAVEMPCVETPAYVTPEVAPQPFFAANAVQPEMQPRFTVYAPQPASTDMQQRPVTVAAQAFQNVSRAPSEQSFATEAPAPLVAEAPIPAVAVEMETGLLNDEDGEMIPDLIHDIENALLDSSIHSASRVDTPVRSADKTRVS